MKRTRKGSAKGKASGLVHRVKAERLGAAAALVYVRNGKTYSHSFTGADVFRVEGGHVVIGPVSFTAGGFIADAKEAKRAS